MAVAPTTAKQISSKRDGRTTGRVIVLRGRLQSRGRQRPGSPRESRSASPPAITFERHGDSKRSPQAKSRQEEKTRRKCSGNCSGSVDPVEAREPRSQLRRTSRESAHEHRQRAAHQKCRQEKYQRRADKPQGQKNRAMSRSIGICRDVDHANAAPVPQAKSLPSPQRQSQSSRRSRWDGPCVRSSGRATRCRMRAPP